MQFSYLKFFTFSVMLGSASVVLAQDTSYKVVLDSLLKQNLPEEALSFIEQKENEINAQGPGLPMAMLINYKAFCFYKLGEWQVADSLYHKAVDIATQTGNTNTVDFATLLADLMAQCGRMGKYDEALDVGERALKIQTEILGETHQKTLRTRRNIGLVYESMGQLDKGRDTYLECLAVFDHNNLPKDLTYASLNRDVAMLIVSSGQFSASKPYFLKAVNLTKQLYGEVSDEYVQMFYSYCWMLNFSGSYVELEPLVTHLVELQRQLPNGENGEYMELGLNMLGVTKNMLGLHAEAIKTLLEAKKVAKVCCGSGFIQRAEVSTNLIHAYFLDGQVEAAYAEALEGNELDKEKAAQSMPVNLLEMALRACTFGDLYKLADAEQILAQIEDRVEWNQQNIVEVRTTYLKAKAQVAFLKNDIPTAMVLLDSAIQNTIATQGPNAPYVASLYTEKATKYFLSHLYEESLDALAKTIKINRFLIQPKLAILSDQERMQLADQLITESSMLATIAWKNPGTNAAAQLFDLQLFTKNLLEKTTRKAAAQVQNSNDPDLKKSYTEWLDVLEQVNFMLQDPAADPEAIRQLQVSAESLEKNLVRKGLAQVEPDKNIYWQDIRAALQPGEAAVDVRRFRLPGIDRITDTVLYAFSIIRPEYEAPKMIFIEKGNDLETFTFGQYQSDIKKIQEVGIISYQKLWAQVAENLNGVKTVYFSPDGIYHKINLNTLRLPDGSSVIDHQSIKLVTNLSELLTKDKQKTKLQPGTAVLFGNPKFDNDLTVNNTSAESSGTIPGTMRDLANAVTNGDFEIKPLPASEKEVNDIARKLTAHQWETKVFTQAQATEAAVKKLQHPSILHIATHGYFLNSAPATTSGSPRLPGAGANPALRSMLFFSGAANSISGEVLQGEDGILTAFEAAVLNLDGTELVVLSACNTGLGKIQNGEGVYGLQRAFRIAGAKSLIMSLWEVEDKATEQFMNNFYENWTSGMSKSAAFRKAQLALKAKYPQPFYWGGFVLVNG